MILCLTCFHPWPDSAQHCGSCGRTFGGARCAHGHLSPKNAAVCITCGSKQLSTPTPSLATSPFSRLLAWAVLLLLLKAVWPFAGAILCSLLGAADKLGGFVFGVSPSAVLASIVKTLTSLAVPVLVLSVLCPGFRRQLPAICRILTKTLRVLWKLSFPVVRVTFRGLSSLVKGVRRVDRS
jgi:hypothetical protein